MKWESEPGELEQALSWGITLYVLHSFTKVNPGFWFLAEGRSREHP